MARFQTFLKRSKKKPKRGFNGDQNPVFFWAVLPRVPLLPRPRSLSIDAGSDGRQLVQEFSPLFTTLPYEVRTRIFAFVFADVVHIEDGRTYPGARDHKLYDPSRARHLMHMSCQQPKPWHGLHNCTEHLNSPEWKTTTDSFLSLPLSCKAIYLETINMLYSEPTFVFEEQHTFRSLRRHVLDQRLSQMAKLVIFFRGPDTDYTRSSGQLSMEELWALLHSMNHLRHLRLTFDLGDLSPRKWRPAEELVRRPAASLVGLRTFELKLEMMDWVVDASLDWGLSCVHGYSESSDDALIKESKLGCALGKYPA